MLRKENQQRFFTLLIAGHPVASRRQVHVCQCAHPAKRMFRLEPPFSVRAFQIRDFPVSVQWKNGRRHDHQARTLDELLGLIRQAIVDTDSHSLRLKSGKGGKPKDFPLGGVNSENQTRSHRPSKPSRTCRRPPTRIYPVRVSNP